MWLKGGRLLAGTDFLGLHANRFYGSRIESFKIIKNKSFIQFCCSVISRPKENMKRRKKEKSINQEQTATGHIYT